MGLYKRISMDYSQNEDNDGRHHLLKSLVTKTDLKLN